MRVWKVDSLLNVGEKKNAYSGHRMVVIELLLLLLLVLFSSVILACD